jgi:hypothetical protein
MRPTRGRTVPPQNNFKPTRGRTVPPQNKFKSCSRPTSQQLQISLTVHLEGFGENLLLDFAVSVQEVEHVLDEPSELKTKAAFVLHFRYTFALQKGCTFDESFALLDGRSPLPQHSWVERLQLWYSSAVVPCTPA